MVRTKQYHGVKTQVADCPYCNFEVPKDMWDVHTKTCNAKGVL